MVRVKERLVAVAAALSLSSSPSTSIGSRSTRTSVEAFLAAPAATAARVREPRGPPLCAGGDGDDEPVPMRGSISPPDASEVGRARGGGARPGRGGGRGAGRGGAGRGSRSSAASSSYGAGAEARGGGGGRGGGRGRGRGDGGGRGGRSGGERLSDPVDAVRAWEGSKVLAQSRRSRGKYMGGKFWWLKEVKEQGMDTLGDMDVWWRTNTDPEAIISEMPSWDDVRLKEELASRSLRVSGSRKEQEARLVETLRLYSLGEDGMRNAPVLDHEDDLPQFLPSCFPDVYEKESREREAAPDSGAAME